MEKDDLALTIAAMAGSSGRIFGDGVVETAKIYKELTGNDLGIKSFEEANNKIKRAKLPWYKRLFN